MKVIYCVSPKGLPMPDPWKCLICGLGLPSCMPDSKYGKQV